MAENNVTRYPLEVVSLVRDKTFYIESNLGVALSKNNRGEQPLMVYDKFSRYVACIINKEKIPATGNIRVEDMWDIQRKSKYYYNKHMDILLEGSSGDKPTSPAYTVSIKGKVFNGKTPVQFLKENPETGIDMMKKQGAYLKGNLTGTYANQNKAQMLALSECIKLHDAGKLDLNAIGNSKEVVLFASGIRPLKSRKLPDSIASLNIKDMSFVYEVTIKWNLGNENNPISVTLENYYCPVPQLPDGRYNAQKSARVKDHVVSNTFNMSVDEWMNAMRYIETDMRNFEILHAREVRTDAETLEKNQRASYQQQANNVNLTFQQNSYDPNDLSAPSFN